MAKPQITKRITKGSALDYSELDTNFQNLADATFALGIPGSTTRTPKTITLSGNANFSTAQSQIGAGSLALDGTGDFISMLSSADFAMGTGDFTIEMWIYKTGTGQRRIYDNRTSNVATTTPMIQTNGFNEITYLVAGTVRITGNVLSDNQWYHLAVSRVSSNTRLFVNGVQQGSTYSDSNNYTQHPLTIGASVSAADFAFAGYLDEIRVSKGLGRYSASFTPSTTAFANDANTVLLIHADTSVEDDGTPGVISVISDLNGVISLVPGSNITFSGDTVNRTITINSDAVGTVNTGSATRLAFYPSAGTVVDDTNINFTNDGSTSTLATASGALNLSASSIGIVMSVGGTMSAGTGSITLSTSASGQIIGLEHNATGTVRVGTSTSDAKISTYPNENLKLDTGHISGGSYTSSSIVVNAGAGANIEINALGVIKVNSTTGTPADTATPASWLKILVGATTYYLPLYA